MIEDCHLRLGTSLSRAVKLEEILGLSTRRKEPCALSKLFGLPILLLNQNVAIG